MGSKQAILKSISAQSMVEVDLPSLDSFGTEYDDPVAKFCEMLPAVGGQCVRVKNKEELTAHLAELEQYKTAKRIFSTMPGLGESNVDLESIDDPAELNGLDLSILPGIFGVAENGAVWVTSSGLKHRLVYFIAEHLILIVPADQIVSNMHQAYERLNFNPPHYGTFLSGPSKTADIEQALVIGAQGPRSLVVYLLENDE